MEDKLTKEKQNNSNLEVLRSALIEGEESEEAGLLDMEEIRIEAKKEIGIVSI